ncbi:MAG TPA: class I SAM-dependent methyltransferase [Paludibaculum sp.]|jgi:SAM-dependent methyltransferase
MDNYHSTRFTPDARREVLWQSLIRFSLGRWIPSGGTVLELGAGYCHFINNIKASRRIALDLWEQFPNYAAKDVETHIGECQQLDFLGDASVDFAFASNLFEHLSQVDFGRTLAALSRKLKPGGLLAILQPNYYYAYREYFDDFTHVAIYSHTSLVDFLKSQGFDVIERHPRFVPFSVKGRLPVYPFLIWLYLRSPFKPGGKQMLVIARPRPNGQFTAPDGCTPAEK